MHGTRQLVVVADDFGIGPATSRGILDLAARGRVTATVLLVNSPYAEEAVRAWRLSGRSLELGWHPCLTLDRPVLPPGQVSSLVTGDGVFCSLGQFLRRLLLRQARPAELEAELLAQYRRFHDLVGHAPPTVNAHHHVHVFAPIGALLEGLLRRQRPLPYVRRVREPWRLLAAVRGARLKRTFLALMGGFAAPSLSRSGFPGNDWLAGVTDPPFVADAGFFARWLARVPGRAVELTCHPGFLDETLAGRDCAAGDAQMLRRPREHALLAAPDFLDACRAARFTLAAPAALARLDRGPAHAA